MMQNNKFSGILKCIKCNGHALEYVAEGKELKCCKCGWRYRVENKVPVMLPEGAHETDIQPELHEITGTTFKYIDHYDKDAHESDYFEVRDSGTEHGERRTREYILSEINRNKGKVLDVGCGKAWVAKLLCPEGFEVVSMDIALKNTSTALELYPYENHYAIVADVFHLPFEDNSFDYIVASEIIEHVYDPKKFVANLIRVLKPGGKLIVTTPYKEKIQYSLCVHCNKPTPVHAHLHSFDEHILTSLYKKQDLKRCNHKTFGNKVIMHLRMHVFLKYFNYRLWKLLDSIGNMIYNVPSRILITWEKQ